MAIATQQPDVLAYTKYDVQLIKVAPDDGLVIVRNMYSQTMKNKEFVQLVVLSP